METWLQANARVVLLAMLLPAVVIATGVALAFTATPWLRAAGVLSVVVGLALLAKLVLELRVPRLAYHDGQLLVFLRGRAPIALPVEIVECFFLGQAESMLPTKRHQQTDSTAAVIIRLADAATEWSQRDVKPALGKWCDGYITIRGTWSEKLDVEKVNRLNQRLVEVKRELRHSGPQT